MATVTEMAIIPIASWGKIMMGFDPQLWQGSPASFTGFIRQKAFCEQEVAQSVGFGCGWAQPS
jgi:hypothetical protein